MPDLLVKVEKGSQWGKMFFLVKFFVIGHYLFQQKNDKHFFLNPFCKFLSNTGISLSFLNLEVFQYPPSVAAV